MFKKILVPTDGSLLSDKAVDAAIKFAKEVNAKVFSISVAEPYPYIPLDVAGVVVDPNLYDEDLLKMHDEQAHKMAQKNVKKLLELAKQIGVTCETKTTISFHPWEEIIKASENFNCDLIIMASHGRKGLNKLFLGSETQKVLANSKIPVLVYR